jgi:hypothetical protein
MKGHLETDTFFLKKKKDGKRKKTPSFFLGTQEIS